MKVCLCLDWKVCVDNRRQCVGKNWKNKSNMLRESSRERSLLWVSKTATQGLISIESANAWDDVCVCVWRGGNLNWTAQGWIWPTTTNPEQKWGGEKSWGNSKIESGNVYLKISREREREKIYGWIDEAFKFIITRYTRQANERKGCW